VAVEAHLELGDDDPLAWRHDCSAAGDVQALERLLAEHPGLARARIESTRSKLRRCQRRLLGACHGGRDPPRRGVLRRVVHHPIET
jgi:CRP-like cAMP-binding protein